jgi:phage protein D
VANDTDVTAAIAERFISLRLSDAAGIDTDTLEVTLADADPLNPIALPKTGAELELFLGYHPSPQRMGLFVCDEVELAGWPGTMTLRARAATYSGTPKGKVSMQTQKTRDWAKGTKLGAMVQKMAKENGMEAAVSKSMAGIVLQHHDQTEESDLSFLLRVVKQYDGIVKPAGGKLMVVRRGESKTVSGDDLPAITVNGRDATNWRLTISRRENPGTVVARWRDKDKSRTEHVTVGKGDPVRKLRHPFPTKDAAEAAAKAALDKKTRGQHEFSVTMPGDPDLSAEARLVLEGFRQHVDGEWLIKRVTHTLDASGYRCDVEAELPNGNDGEPSKPSSGDQQAPFQATPAPAPAPSPSPAKIQQRDKATVQAERDKLSADWMAEIKRSQAVAEEAYTLRDAGNLAGSKAKLDEAAAINDDARATYSSRYDQLKAELAAFP